MTKRLAMIALAAMFAGEFNRRGRNRRILVAATAAVALQIGGLAVGYVGTQFTEGKRTVRGDCRVALIFTRAAAFCSVTGL